MPPVFHRRMPWHLSALTLDLLRVLMNSDLFLHLFLMANAVMATGRPPYQTHSPFLTKHMEGPIPTHRPLLNPARTVGGVPL